MASKMLIDAAHPEETRVVVVHGHRVEEFDFESENRRQLRGNIYLAKVTRVEPSLQAAFVEYGGNRHGFLAFSEIHPDYYQIPVADREAILRQQEQEAISEAAEEDREAEQAEVAASNSDAHEKSEKPSRSRDGDDDEGSGEALAVESDQTIESVGAEDALEEIAPRRQRNNQTPARSYKIQEVIKRRQIILIQVVKEERGNKGAALTTYLSLAGRYCVLMPNTARGGGISRKISAAADRKKLKDIAQSLEVPEGMGLIIRTAGAKRTKVEVKRDYEYLLRMWESVRELTLKSSAPSLVYEEGSLIKRAIRDLYDKDIEEVLVEGDEGYREAKNFMRMLMPSHAKNVQPYKDRQPLFQRYQVENQLDSMFNPTVSLKSGGYIVINPTEALVSVDVNSGKATKERNIEATALKTNMEAAEEVARQMRLRDLAGLIVIDFIDMDESRNNRAVERRLKECLKNDRARLQVGRISHFGLLEMSRQRMRSGVLEGSTITCPHCMGTGLVRSVESMALHVLRAVEAEAIRGMALAFTVKVPGDVAIYILNQKRSNLLDVEQRYGVSVFIEADPTLKGAELVRIESAAPRDTGRARPAAGAISISSSYSGEDAAAAALEANTPVIIEIEAEEAEEHEGAPLETEDDGQPKRKRRRRRRGRGASGEAEGDDNRDGAGEERAKAGTGDAEEDGNEGDDEEDGRPRRRRRRGRRGGRRNRRREGDEFGQGDAPTPGVFSIPAASEFNIVEADDDEGEHDGEIPENEPVLLAYFREDAASAPIAPAVQVAETSAPEQAQEPVEIQIVSAAEPVATAPASVFETIADEPIGAVEPIAAEPASAPEPEPASTPEPAPEPAAAPVIEAVVEAVTTPAVEAVVATPPEPEKPAGPPRRGWWNRGSN